jgi:hypothetical protein
MGPTPAADTQALDLVGSGDWLTRIRQICRYSCEQFLSTLAAVGFHSSVAAVMFSVKI